MPKPPVNKQFSGSLQESKWERRKPLVKERKLGVIYLTIKFDFSESDHDDMLGHLHEVMLAPNLTQKEKDAQAMNVATGFLQSGGPHAVEVRWQWWDLIANKPVGGFHMIKRNNDKSISIQ